MVDVDRGRPAVSTLPAGRGSDALAGISVVIPTYNRCDLLLDTLDACRRCAGGVDLEFLVVDDGSHDDTPHELEKLAKVMPALVWRRVASGGPGRARNLGASLATREVVLFLGDDIRPANDSFFRVHAELHARHPGSDLAVLGKVVWPDRGQLDVNAVMRHIQGRGGEQFGYADLTPFRFLDWRFFYTANVSVKRGLVDDWVVEGFHSAFSQAAYEDVEFAYRMMRNRDPGLRILYAPSSLATHHHSYSLAGFMERQTTAGMMARVFVELHSSLEVRDRIAVERVHRALALPSDPGAEKDVGEYLSVVEGIKSWARLLDSHGSLGCEPWHKDLLSAVFALCYLQGYVINSSEPDANHAAAYQLLLDDFFGRMHRSVEVELSDLALERLRQGLAGSGAFGSWLRHSALWRWARTRPELRALYRYLRRGF